MIRQNQAWWLKRKAFDLNMVYFLIHLDTLSVFHLDTPSVFHLDTLSVFPITLR